MKPEGSSPHSHEPATCPYTEPVRSSPRPHIPLSNLPLINSSNSGTCYCKQQLSEWIGEETEQREQAALTYGIESGVETCLYGTQTCNASRVPHGWK